MRIVFSTFPDLETARKIGRRLVEMQLAACVNLLPGAESIYRWQGNVETAAEIFAVFKTTAAVFPRFVETLVELHPYDVPEIVALEPTDVSPTYRRWWEENSRGRSAV